jgi:hypothetical protein
VRSERQAGCGRRHLNKFMHRRVEAQIQKVSAQLETSKPLPQVVNNP